VTVEYSFLFLKVQKLQKLIKKYESYSRKVVHYLLRHGVQQLSNEHYLIIDVLHREVDIIINVRHQHLLLTVNALQSQS